MDLNLIILLILIGGYIAGKLFSACGLPAILGMTLWGVLLSITVSVFPPALAELSVFLRSAALIIILLRAGLGIRRQTLAKVGKTALLMAFIPCLCEGLALMVLFAWLTPFDWLTSGLTGFLLAAVSPAVVIPSMLQLKDKGLGRQNEVPTLVLAGASLDDIFAITVFLAFLNLLGGQAPNAIHAVLSIPVSVALGILPGIVAGLALARWFNAHFDKIRATEKTLLLLGSAIFLLQVGHWLHTAALLGIMTIGFILLEKAPRAADELAYNLNKMWVFAEIVLFVLIGMSVDVRLALSVGPQGLLIITLGLIARSGGVWLATAFSPLSWRERLFCVLAYLPKATVQAAMGAVPLAMGVPGGESILAYAVLSILFTAPLGLLAIRFFAEPLLTHRVRIADSTVNTTKIEYL